MGAGCWDRWCGYAVWTAVASAQAPAGETGRRTRLFCNSWVRFKSFGSKDAKKKVKSHCKMLFLSEVAAGCCAAQQSGHKAFCSSQCYEAQLCGGERTVVFWVVLLLLAWRKGIPNACIPSMDWEENVATEQILVGVWVSKRRQGISSYPLFPYCDCQNNNEPAPFASHQSSVRVIKTSHSKGCFLRSCRTQYGDKWWLSLFDFITDEGGMGWVITYCARFPQF